MAPLILRRDQILKAKRAARIARRRPAGPAPSLTSASTPPPRDPATTPPAITHGNGPADPVIR
jgi:hypothetical protein